MTPAPAEVSLSEAERIAAAVSSLPSVAGLHSGRFGLIASFGPGRRVNGVRIDEEAVTVSVTVEVPFVADTVATAVRSVVRSHDRAVNVFIADLADPER
ncbi:hypothetical protein [Lentzea sp.]|uniref:hypothetical protein n=1 Tax=Lentzea sp. TaxID=56099 RepID=UPI002ED2190B